ncbi:segregation/condensation protein A [Metabacillus halosaccharovorans]|uniref:Segregation and condensation protein A n=1 Tax=Metabacillus halosaccharovorans TaxID=930124 RepID=A0ABT3DMK3_9BACI|nr:segregation/condensation protein A [Metabacillus halosaccharovorans]MCV9888295.1 segregation/condensation protein A [Metabacillus halosaccharovorans]
MLKYHVKIDAFEGPLDLLLHLINRLEIDIYDIPVSEITEQYMLYIHTMQELQLDIASEYLVMAATLLSIKSRMLLPKQEEELFEDEYGEEPEEDPRDELMRRLIEYRKYKEAAEDLRSLEEDRSQVYTKAPSDLSEFVTESTAHMESLNVSIYDMLGAFQKMLRRKKIQKPVQTKIARQEIPIEKRMEEILTDLRSKPGRRKFQDLFPSNSKEHLVVTFLAILELMKTHSIVIEQENNFSDIFIMGSET